jgi:hypothetical protein
MFAGNRPKIASLMMDMVDSLYSKNDTLRAMFYKRGIKISVIGKKTL